MTTFVTSERGVMKIRADKDAKLGWLSVGSLSVFLVVGMFYVLPSGAPQPSALLFVLIAAFLGWPAMQLSIAYANHAMAVLVLWIAIVNGVWFILTGNNEFVASTLYYVYNLLVFIIFSYVYAQHRNLAHSWWRVGILAALLIQVVIVVGGADVYRATGTFNNPNQLGYWSILLLATYGVISHHRKLSWIDLGIVVLALWICMQSVSRAAVAPAVVLCLVFLFLHPAHRHVKAVFLCAFGGILVIFAIQGGTGHDPSGMQRTSSLEDRVEERYSRVLQTPESQLKVRGYDRIWRFPEYNFLGAGEGAYKRIQITKPGELHSSFGTMLFCYGVIGLALFVVVLYQSLRATPLIVKAYVMPVLIYGLAHQGVRFTYFWVLLGIVAGISGLYRAERSRRGATSKSTSRSETNIADQGYGWMPSSYWSRER